MRLHDEEWMEDARDEARRKANFCLVTGVQPSEYDNLTELEIEEFIDEYNKLHKKK